MISSWNAPLPSGKSSEEMLVAFDQARERRVLVLPAWFDEANKLRRFTLQTMRNLDALGVDSFLPDFPGCNESLAPLQQQTLSSWRICAEAAAGQVKATDVLAVRSGALLAPQHLRSWLYAPHNGPKLLRGMIRARTIAARESGRSETSDDLLAIGRDEGIVLAGWHLGAEMVRELETAQVDPEERYTTIAAKDLGGAGLWLRAEPGEDDAQSAALAETVSGTEAISA